MLKIAVCDDCRMDVGQLETALGALSGYQIEYDVYFSAVDLLKDVSHHMENYHLYIFDIEMPGMTGLELAREIRKSGTKALFVFLTGYSQYVIPEPACACALILLAAVWAQVDVKKSPYFNLLVLAAVLTLVTLFF